MGPRVLRATHPMPSSRAKSATDAPRARRLAAVAIVATLAMLATSLAGAQPRPKVAAGFPIGQLLPDGEFVFGPTLFSWDAAAFIDRAGGYLARYQETVDGETLSGPAIVQRVAEDYSVGTRMLLALVEMHGGWVQSPAPAERDFPVGEPVPGLFAGLSAAADSLNKAYYGYRFGGQRSASAADGTAVDIPATNAATFALLAYLGRGVPADTWSGLEGASRFYAAWMTLFGDPIEYAIGSPSLDAPPAATLELPFGSGEMWFFVAGPHSAWGAGGPRAAVDFAPPPEAATGCTPSPAWVTAAAPGRVVRSRASGVAVDLDRNGFEGTGWVHVYSHLSAAERIAVGADVDVGTRLGHPACEGGLPTQSRVAFARKFHGEWVPADDPRAPLVLGGWAVLPGTAAGEGTLIHRDAEPRTADPAKAGARNGVVVMPGSP